MRRFLTITILVSTAILIIGSTVSAQGHMGRGMGGPGKRWMHQKNLESLRLLKLLDVLDLDDDRNDLFISTFSKFRRNSKSIREDIEQEVSSLRDYLREGNKSDDAILNKIDSIISKKEQIEQERKKFFNKIKDILSVEQLGRMIVFHERFERELLEKVRGFRAPKPADMPNAPLDPANIPATDTPEIDN